MLDTLTELYSTARRVIMKKQTWIVILLIAGFLGVNTVSAAPELKVYEVANIKQGDSLNMRAWPNIKSTVIVALPHNAQWLAYSGSTSKKGNSSWKKVHWNSQTGWVNDKYLKYDPDKTAKAIERRDHRLKQQSKTSRNTPQAVAQTASNKVATKKPTTPKQKEVILACGGNTPFWNIHMNLSSKKINVDLEDGKPFTSPLYYRKWTAGKNEMRINGGRGRNIVQATLDKTNTCRDGLTNIKYPFSITATVGNTRKVTGCCRTIAK